MASGSVDRTALGLPWSSPTVPDWTLAPAGSMTPGGAPAVFRSSPHAWVAIRLAYLAECTDLSSDAVADRAAEYRKAWDDYVELCGIIVAVADGIADDIEGAAALWNTIDQPAADRAFTAVLGEREPFPTTNLANVAAKRFGLVASGGVPREQRDRTLTAADNEAAWRASPHGACRGCGTSTVSQTSYNRLRRQLRQHSDLFDLTPSYQQRNGTMAPLWSNRIVIAAKGVADHRIPWSQGGRTDPENLANTCAACNYTRNDASLDAVRVADYV